MNEITIRNSTAPTTGPRQNSGHCHFMNFSLCASPAAFLPESYPSVFSSTPSISVVAPFVSFDVKFCIENEMPSVRSPVLISVSSMESVVSERYAISISEPGRLTSEISSVMIMNFAKVL